MNENVKWIAIGLCAVAAIGAVAAVNPPAGAVMAKAAAPAVRAFACFV